jgi:hypothetical protein
MQINQIDSNAKFVQLQFSSNYKSIEETYLNTENTWRQPRTLMKYIFHTEKIQETKRSLKIQ